MERHPGLLRRPGADRTRVRPARASGQLQLDVAGHARILAAGGVPIAGVFNPGGAGAPAANGGLVVSGRWPFASGVTYARWVLANVIVLDDAGVPKPGIGGLPEIRTVVVRNDDVTLIDDWFARGTRRAAPAPPRANGSACDTD